jgi:trimeric autotransporter adhesin
VKSTPWSVCTGLLVSIVLSAPVVAQVQNPEDITPTSTGSAVDLKIMPRLGVGYSTSGAGYDGFTRFEGFVPLLQNPGTNLTFLEGRLLLDNSAQLGGNLLLGHRLYNSQLNRTFGGYLSYDNRNTGKSSFNQLGLGFESLGGVWDFRANGYIPLGSSRKLVSESSFDTGLQTSGNPFFQGNYLITQAIRESQQIRRYETALGGFDIEAGAKIAKLGNSGDLRGYGGVYYYTGKGTDSALGWRVRMEARPTDNLNFGLAVQDDRIFGTNVLFNVGITFPGTRPKRFKNESESVVARLGESISRTNSIAVDSQTEATSFSQNVTVAATNPQTGAPYVFQHVNSGQAGGNGTFENPFGAIDAALGATQSDGNSIVYVSSASNSPALSSFQIRDGVQVLSSGFVQEILTREFGLVRLPGSGSGNLPNVAGSVTLGNNTVLSGFAIASTNAPGIEARNINNAVIRDNTVISTAQTGVRLENVTGTVALNNNTITSNNGVALEATNINNASITQSSLASTNSATNGISLNGVSGTVDVINSTLTVTNPTLNGLSAENITGTVNITANSGSEINTSGTAVGILLRESTGSVNLSGLQVSSTGGAVLEATNLNNANISQSILSSTNSATNGITLNGVNGTVDVTNSTVSVTNPTGNGISAENVRGTVNIAANSGSQINTNGTAASISLRESTGSVNLSGLQATATGGAVLEATNLNNANISQSTLSSTNSATNGITLNGVNGTVDVTNSTVSVTNPTGNGISAENVRGTVNIAANSGSQINTNGTAASISLRESTGSVNLSGLQATATGGAVLEEININNANISQSTLSSTNSATNGITLNGVNGTVDVSNSTVSVTNPTGNGISAENVRGTVNIAANSGSQINTNGTAASISLRESTGSVNLSGLQATATGGAVLEATNLNEANITQSTLSSTNSATNGITLNGVTGTVDVSNSTVSVTNPTANGISATNVSGTVNLAANTSSQISQAGSDGVRLEQVTGGLTLSGFEIADSVNNGIAAVNSRNLTIQGNTIRNSGIDGISLNNVTGITTLTNNQITNSAGDAIGLTNTTGQTQLTITQNQLDTNAKGINLSVEGNAQVTAQITNNQIFNTTTESLLINLLDNAQLSATVSNNQVTNAGTNPLGNGVLLVTRGNTASTFTFSNNSFTNVGNRYGFYLDTGENSSSNFIFSNNQLTSGTGVLGGVVLENNSPGSRLCVQLNGNTSSGASVADYALSNNANSLYQVVDLSNVTVNNTGNLQFFSDPFTNVQLCPAP